MPDYFTLADFRLLPNMGDDTKYPDVQVEAAADWAEGIIERATGTSFVARTVTAEIHDGGVYGIVLRKPFVLSVTSASESGVAVTDTLTAIGGVLQRYGSGASSPTMWTSGSGNVSVTYQAGRTATPPADIAQAAMQATRYRLVTFYGGNAGLTDRTTSISNETGTTSLAIAGPDAPTGLPEVDATINAWSVKFGFA